MSNESASAPDPDLATTEIDRLLEKLNSGDANAAEAVFHTYEPYLRLLVRRQIRPPLRAKFDSMDVVQSVWADVLEGVRDANWHFKDRAHLQAFLVRLTRNRFLDRCRKHRTALAIEEPLMNGETAYSILSSQPRPSEVVVRDEAWDRMLALCPPAHHELLYLKRAGMTISEIAERTALHSSSVRRILYDLARKFAAAGGGTDSGSGTDD